MMTRTRLPVGHAYELYCIHSHLWAVTRGALRQRNLEMALYFYLLSRYLRAP